MTDEADRNPSPPAAQTPETSGEGGARPRPVPLYVEPCAFAAVLDANARDD